MAWEPEAVQETIRPEGKVVLAVPGADGRAAGELVLGRGAFGSGEHETTASCLRILAELASLRGATVLDVGCGTGVLALGALRLGATRAVCLDIEPRAAALARANAAAAGLALQVGCVAGELACLAEVRFEVIAANLPANVLLASAAALVERTVPGGWLVLSGVLWEEAWAVRAGFERLGCRCRRERWLEEYCTFLLHNARS